MLLGILLARNAWLFSLPVYEDADMGAYSIQVEQARRFTLLVGNYSRQRFNHPGPAFLYVQAWGEEFAYDLLRIVPAAWNGEVIGLYLLNAFCAACVVVTGARWGGAARGSAVRDSAGPDSAGPDAARWDAARGGLIALAAVALLGALHPSAFASDWMPYAYVPAYLAFLVSVASVAGGRTKDAWLAALSGWFLIHGHACFLFIVPSLWLAAALARAVPARRRRRLAWPRPPLRAWLPVAAISAVFALPIVADLALHWPGNFGKYLAYTGSARPGGHPAAQVADYVLWFWWPHPGAWAAVPLLALAATAAAAALPAGQVRRFCLALLAVDALSTAAFILYAAAGVDDLTQHYMGYFAWTGPLIAGWVLAWAGTELLSTAGTRAAAALALAACAAFAVAPQTRLSTGHADPANPVATGPVADPSLPAGVARIGALAAGRYAVLTFAQGAWPTVTGILVQAERSGVRACVADKTWQFMMTSQFTCTQNQLAGGLRLRVVEPGHDTAVTPALVQFRRGIVTWAAK